MNEFIEKLIGRLEEWDKHSQDGLISVMGVVNIVNQLAEEYKTIDVAELVEKFGQEKVHSNDGWIPCSEQFPECENKYGWVSCIVSVIRSHYPTSTYDICDSPYDENIVMHANYHVSQKIWHLESDEQLNALMDIEDAPLNCDYVIAWQPLPEPYKPKGE